MEHEDKRFFHTNFLEDEESVGDKLKRIGVIKDAPKLVYSQESGKLVKTWEPGRGPINSATEIQRIYG